MNGGEGAIVEGTLAVTPGATIFIKPGGAGGDTLSGAGGTGGYNGGGVGGNGSCYTQGGGAGGYNGGGVGGNGSCYTQGGGAGGGGVTQIFEDETTLAAAGGGSGATYGRNGVSAGGNSNGDGTIGLPDSVPGANFGSPGGPGTESAGGAGGDRAVNSTAPQGNGTAGSGGVGGNGGTAVAECGASGGGAGRFGGGGGGTSTGSWASATGGSGSSYTSEAVSSRTISVNPVREAGWVKISTDPGPGPGPVVKKPGKPTKVKVSGKPNAAKHVVSWRKSKNATKASRYTVRVFKPRSKKSVIIMDKTKGLKVTFTRKQLLKAWKKSLKTRGEVTSVVAFRVTITATTGSKRSAAAVTKILVKV